MNESIVALAIVGACIPAAASAQDAAPATTLGGLRVEARATYETPTVSSIVEDDDVYKLGSAFAFGGEIGYDAPLGDWTVGPYAQYEFSTVENCDGSDCLSVKNYLEAGLSVGYSVAASGLVYGKIGYGEMTLEATDETDTVSDGIGGVAFALGYEQGFGNNFYGRVEGGYADLGQYYGINMQRRHAGVALGMRF